ncbi:MAG: oligosaccharide flippase family protein [Oscillospiraceae bacterium]
MKLDRSSMLYGTLLLTATGLCSQVLGFLYRIALSRLIGAELMGLYQLILPVYSVLSSLTVVGLTVAVSTLSAEYHAKNDPGAIRQVRRTCLRCFFLLLAPLAVLAALLSDPISVYILGDARTRLGLLLLLPCLLLTGVENLQKHAFFGVGNVRPPAFAELAEQLIRAAAVLGLLVVFLPQNPERTVGLITLGMVLCEVFSAVTLTVLFRRWMGGGPMGTLPSGALRRRIFKIASPVGLTALLGNLMASACAVLIPQKLVAGGATVREAMSAFGVLSGMTLPLLALPSALIGALGLVLVPKLAESVALGDQKTVSRRMNRVLLGTSVLILPAMALLVVVGPGMGQLLFHEPTVGEHCLPLAVCMALACYQSVLSCALNGIGKQSWAAKNAILSGGVQLLFTVFTVEKWGLSGYVAGCLASTVLGLTLNWIDVRRATGLRLRLFSWFVAPGLAAVLMGLNCNLLFQVLQERGVTMTPAVLVCLAFGTGFYLLALAAQGVHPLRPVVALLRGAPL